MPNTKFWNWTYPEDNEEPYFEKEEGFKTSTDSAVYSILNTASNIIIPPATISWDSMTKVLSWTGQFEIPLMSIGYSLLIPFGPDGLTASVTMNDGDRLYVVVPNTASGNVSTNLKIAVGKVTTEEGVITVGYCKNGNFYANFANVL